MFHIIAVDDDELVLNALRRELFLVEFDHRRFDIELFTSPREALKRARESRVDAVISDYRMPEMDGAAFLAAFAEIQPHTARILLSGQADLEGLRQAINAAHIHYYVAKPWSAYELRCMLNQAVDQTILLHQNEQHARMLAQKLDVRRLLKGPGRQQVLVVDDEPAVVKAMERELSDRSDVFDSLYLALRVKISLGEHPAADNLDYQVTTATSPQQALEWAARHQVDLLVTDIAMPGMDGTELAVQMRKTHPDLSVIVVSGQADLHTLRESLNLARLDFFIAKPWEREQLRLFVAQALVGQIIRREHRQLAAWLRERGLA